MNPRYAAYAAAKGNDPKKQLELDKIQYPGGCMCGFILFISSAVELFKQKHPEAFVGKNIRDQALFTKFIQENAKNILASYSFSL